ncbi:MAG: ABC transporter substrate-binding protein [Actinomycetes bacterium]
MSDKNMAGTRRRIIATAAAAALAAGGLLVGGATGASAAAAKTGGTLYMVTHNGQFAHADPQRNYTGQDIAFFNTYVYRNLVVYKPAAGPSGSGLVADLATNTGVPSNNAKTWKFTLRKGVKWEDGSAITCADVKYGVSRTYATDVITDGPAYALSMLNIPNNKDGSSQYAGPYKKTGQALFDKAVTCSKDNMTITFNLGHSVADFNYAASYPAFGPVKASKDTGDKYDLKPMASGPYKIAKYTINGEMDLVRNSNWSKATDIVRPAYPDNVTVRFGLDSNVIDQIMLTDSIPNTVNLDGLQPVNNQKFFADDKYSARRMNVNDPYVRYYGLNSSPGHLDCLLVRKAFFFAWNTQALIDLSGGAVFYGAIGDSPVKPVLGLDYAPTTGNTHDSNFKASGNPDYAKTLLAEAKTACPATYAKVTGDAGLSIDLPNNATQQKASVLIKAALSQAGFNVKFNFIPGGQYYPTVQDITKQGDASRAGWGADWANASTVIPPLYLKDGGFDLSGNWGDPVYAGFAAKVTAALAMTDRPKQAAEWKKLAQFAMDQYWISVPIFTKQQLDWGSKVGGVAFWDPQGTFLFPALYVK